MNRVEITVQEIDEPQWMGKMEAFALKILGQRGHENWDLSLMLCNDAVIRELNRDYRDKDEATDVLSFQLGEEVEDEELGLRWLPGDIAISLETLPKNAEYFNVSQDEELRRLTVHGILHLEGLDHEDNDPDRPMLKLQEEILSKNAEERILS